MADIIHLTGGCDDSAPARPTVEITVAWDGEAWQIWEDGRRGETHWTRRAANERALDIAQGVAEAPEEPAVVVRLAPGSARVELDPSDTWQPPATEDLDLLLEDYTATEINQALMRWRPLPFREWVPLRAVLDAVRDGAVCFPVDEDNPF